jgi:hypothetical protein
MHFYLHKNFILVKSGCYTASTSLHQPRTGSTDPTTRIKLLRSSSLTPSLAPATPLLGPSLHSPPVDRQLSWTHLYIELLHPPTPEMCPSPHLDRLWIVPHCILSFADEIRPPPPPHGMELCSPFSCREWATSPSGWSNSKWADQFWPVGIVVLVNLPWNCWNLFKSVQTFEIS